MNPTESPSPKCKRATRSSTNKGLRPGPKEEHSHLQYHQHSSTSNNYNINRNTEGQGCAIDSPNPLVIYDDDDDDFEDFGQAVDRKCASTGATRNGLHDFTNVEDEVDGDEEGQSTVDLQSYSDAQAQTQASSDTYQSRKSISPQQELQMQTKYPPSNHRKDIGISHHRSTIHSGKTTTSQLLTFQYS